MLNNIRRYFRQMKLTNRITLSNVILFSLLTLLILYFVTVLTRQFLFYKNQEELFDKQTQIQDTILAQMSTLESLAKSDRLLEITYSLDRLYIFDSYKIIALVSDHDNRTSYGMNKSYYDRLMYGDLNASPFDFALRTHFNNVANRITFEIYQTFSSSELSNLYEITLDVPEKNSTMGIHPIHFASQRLLYTTIRFDFDDDSSIFISLFYNPEFDSDFILSLNSALFVSALIGILLITIFGKYFTKRALKPLMDLSYIAQNVNNETLSYRIPSSNSNDEVDTLIKSLNLMLENLEKSFHDQSRFVSDASHELRIPLTVVMGYIDLLKTVGREDQGLLDEALDAIEAEAQNMKSLVEKLLLIARLESKRFKPHIESIDTKSFFSKIITESEMLYNTHHFSCHYTYDGMILADKELLKQIIRAVIENAVKYSDAQSNIDLVISENEKYHQIAVHDNGRGIPKEAIERLSNRFYRVDEDRNRKTGGAGLGLAIVDGFMKAHGGYLKIESEDGKGTSVILLFQKALNKSLES